MRLWQEIQEMPRRGVTQSARRKTMSTSLRRFPIRTHIAATVLCGVLCPLTNYGAQDIKPKSSARERGVELFQQQKFDEAIEVLRTAVAADKKDHEAWYYLGLSQLRNKDFKSASKSFETALKINSQSAAAHAALGYALLQQNKMSEAARHAQTAINIDSTIADAYYILGVTQLRRGATTDAAESADKAIRLRPQFAPSYLLKAESLVSFIGDALAPEPAPREVLKERYGKAIEALEKYLQLAPTAPNKEFWREQLASLKFYIGEPAAGESEKTLRSSEVTTRARVLSKPEPAYTDAARAHQVRGTVILRAVFASDGAVKHLIVVRGLPDGLTEVSIAAAKRIKFVPATVNGRPVSMWMQLEYNFSLY